MTIQDAAKSAVLIQDACNLSGVVFEFARCMQAICDEAQRLGKGTQWKNQHPIVTAFLLKLSDLNGVVQSPIEEMKSYVVVELLAKGENISCDLANVNAEISL